MASSDTKRVIKNAAYRLTGRITSATTFNPITGGLTGLATASGRQVSKDQAAFANATNDAVEIGTTGYFYQDLTATEMTADHIRWRVAATNANQVEATGELFPEACMDSGTATAGSTTSITLPSTASSTDSLYNGCEIELVRGTGAGQTRSILTYLSRVVTPTRAFTTAPDSTTVYIIKGHDNLDALYGSALVSATVNDGSATATAFKGDSTLSTTDSFYASSVLVFTSGTLKGLARKITGYTGTTRSLAFATAFPSAPANGDAFIILGYLS